MKRLLRLGLVDRRRLLSAPGASYLLHVARAWCSPMGVPRSRVDVILRCPWVVIRAGPSLIAVRPCDPAAAPSPDRRVVEASLPRTVRLDRGIAIRHHRARFAPSPGWSGEDDNTRRQRRCQGDNLALHIPLQNLLQRTISVCCRQATDPGSRVSSEDAASSRFPCDVFLSAIKTT